MIRKKKRITLIPLILVLTFLLIITFYLFRESLEKEKNYIHIPPTGEININNESEKRGTLIKIDYGCSNDEDCYLTSTNCCPEYAGAYWECIGKNSIIICDPEGILCMQILSPKPNITCKCVNNFCIPQ